MSDIQQQRELDIIRKRREAAEEKAQTAQAAGVSPAESSALQNATSLFQRYDLIADPEGARSRLRTDGKVPSRPGASEWEYVPEEVATRWETAIRESSDPEDMEYRLRGAWYLSRLTGSSFEEAFADHEGMMRSWRNEALQPRTWAEAVQGTWQSAWISTEIAKRAYTLWNKGYSGEDIRTDPLYQEILALEAQMPPPDQMKRWLPTQAVKALAQFIPSFMESMGAGAVGGAVGAAGTGAMAGAAGLAGAVAPIGGAVIGAATVGAGALVLPAIVAAGFAVGSAAGSGLKSRELETGSTYYDLLRYVDPNTGARINPQAALLWSGVYGGLAAAVESLQMDTFFKAFPGLNGTAKKAITKAVEESLEDKTAAAARSGVLQRAMGRFAAAQGTKLGGRAADIAGETMQEVLQEALNIGAEALARDATRRIDGAVLSPIEAQDVALRLKDTIVQSTLGFTAMHALPASISLFMDAGQEGAKAKKAADVYSREETGPVEVKPEDMELFRRRAEEKPPEGLHLQPTEEIEGEQYVMKAGVGKDRVGSLRYAIEPGEDGALGTVRILGLEKGTAPNVGSALVRSVAFRFPGWNIEWDARSPSQAALKQYLTETNPRGPAAGLQGFAAPREMPGQVTAAYLKERIRDVAPGWTDEEIDVGAKIFGAWGRKLGMTADQLADAALSPEVFGQVMSRAAVAQGATGATAQVRVGDSFKALIQLAPTANPSTIVHEATHAVVLFARQAAEKDQRARTFLLELESALGVKDGAWEAEFGGWTEEYRGGNRSYMEALTYALEDYFTTGKPPKPELADLFKKLAQWVLDIYKAMKGARVQISPELTAYFDDLIGGEGSPFAESRQSEAELAADEAEAAAAPKLARELGPASPTPLDDLGLFQAGPAAERQGMREELERAKALAAEGADPEEETGWRQEGDGTWTRDRKRPATPAPLAPGAQESIRQASVDSAGAETSWGPVLGQEKAYGEVQHEGLERIQRNPLYQGERVASIARDEAIDQVQAALEERAIPYEMLRSRQSNSIYARFTHKGETFNIRISDHPNQSRGLATYGAPDFDINFRKPLDLEALKKFLDAPVHRTIYYQGGAHSLDQHDLAREGIFYQLEGLNHGAKAGFDRFDHSYMGSGEGQQIYGWGTYLTENRNVARRQYAERLGMHTVIRVNNNRIAVPLKGIPDSVVDRVKREVTREGPSFPLRGPELASRLRPMIERFTDEAIAESEYSDDIEGTTSSTTKELRAFRASLDEYTWDDADIAGGRWLYTVNVETHGKEPEGGSGLVMLTAEMLARGEVGIGSSIGDYVMQDIAEFWNDNMAGFWSDSHPDSVEDGTITTLEVKKMFDRLKENISLETIPAISRKAIEDWIDAGARLPNIDNAPAEIAAHAKELTRQVMAFLERFDQDSGAEYEEAVAAAAIWTYFRGPDDEPILFLRPNDKTPEDEVATPGDGRWIRWDKPVKAADVADLQRFAFDLTSIARDKGAEVMRAILGDFTGEDWEKVKGNIFGLEDALGENLDGGFSGKEFYEMVVEELGTAKAASLFLYAAGFDGVKYPVAFLTGGKGDQGSNYVVFNDASINITKRALFQAEGWHGTGTGFDRFSTDFIGQGEGAQAFGWGLYFTSEESIGRHYAHKIGMDGVDRSARFKVLTDEQNDQIPDWMRDTIARAYRSQVPGAGLTAQEKELSRMEPKERATWTVRMLRADFEHRIYDLEGQIARSAQPWIIEGNIAGLKRSIEVLRALEEAGDFTPAEEKPRRHLYRVVINRGATDLWLDWEKPLTEQSPAAQAALQSLGIVVETQEQMEERLKAKEKEIEDRISMWAIGAAEDRMADSAPSEPDYEIRYNEDDETWDIYLDGEYEDWAETEEAAEKKALKVAQKAFEKAMKSWGSAIHNAVDWAMVERQVEREMAILREEALKFGRDAYQELTFRANDNPREASLSMLRAGFTGIRYPAASMGIGAHSKGTNYVVFDDSLVEIEEHILYQHGEEMRTGVARSKVAMYQGADGDEAGVDTLKELARESAAAGEGWEDFMAFVEAMYTEAERENWKMPLDLPPDAKRVWYKRLFEEAMAPPDQDQDLAAWLNSLAENEHAGLMQALKAVWTEVLLAEKLDLPPRADEDEAREWQERKARAGELKTMIAEPIIAAAARVGGKGLDYLMPQMRGSLMGIIRRNPEDYAAVFGEITGNAKIQALGQKATAEKYADIPDPKLKAGLSISQRAALAGQVRDEKLAKAIRSGEVVVGEDVKALIDRAKQAEKASQARIKALTQEAAEATVDLDDQGKALADAQGKYAETKKEIARTLARLRRFEATGGERPSLLESRRAKLEKEAEALRGKLKAAGDWVVLEEELAAAKKAESRADRAIRKMQAAGDRPGAKLLQARSEARAKARSLEAKLEAAKEYKNLPQLQTYLAKTEAIAKERRKIEVAQAERQALKKLQAYRKQLEKAIMAPPAATVRVDEARQIHQIQQTLSDENPSARTKEMLDALRDDLAKNPALAREVPKKWLARLGRPTSEMSLAELEETARRIKDLRDQGRAALAQIKRDRDEEIMEAQIRIAESVMAVKGYREPEGYEAEKTLLDKLKGKLRDFDYAFLSMRRFANWMDGGEDGPNVRTLWHEMNRHYREEMIERKRRTERILAAFKDAELDPEDWYNTRVEIPEAGPGRITKTLRKSDLMALELAFRNEDSRQAALFGCFFSAKERKSMDEEELYFEGASRFTAIRAAIDQALTDKDKKVLEAFSADAAETAPRLAEVVARVENREMLAVADYFPIVRELVTGTPIDVQVAGDVLDRTAGTRRPPRNGFTKERVRVSPKAQTPIKLDLLSTWLESIGRQEHYVATAEYGKRLDAYYLAPYVQEQIRGAFGQEGIDYVKEYLAEVKNPGDLRNHPRWENSIRYLRGNLGAAYLAWKGSSVLKQLIASPWPTLPYAGPRLFAEAAKALANPARYLKETEGLSTFLQNRTADIVLEAVKEAKAGSRGAKLLLKANQAGMKGLELADRFSVAIGWRAVYEKALVEFGGDHAKAEEKADDAIMKSQPSARGVDLAPIYRGKGETLKTLLQFAQAINVIWQNIRYDVPTAMKAHQFKTAIGILVSYSIAGILLNAATQGLDEDDDKAGAKLAFWTLTQGTDSVPLIGQDLTRALRRGLTGEKSTQMGDTALPAIAEIAEGMYRMAGGELDRAAEKFYRGGGMVLGIPVSGIREFGRVITGDHAALLGRPDKE